MKCFIFPLVQTNLFPTTTKPLNIFEPQYLQMIEDAVNEKIPVALAYVPQNGDTYRSVVGYGHPQIVEKKANESMLIFINGEGKARILDILDSQGKPYLIAEVEVFHEELEVDESLKSQYKVLNYLLAMWIEKHIYENDQREIFMKSLKGPREIIAAMSAYLIRDYDLQYEMMEIHSINEQIQFLFRLYESKELTM